MDKFKSIRNGLFVTMPPNAVGPAMNVVEEFVGEEAAAEQLIWRDGDLNFCFVAGTGELGETIMVGLDTGVADNYGTAPATSPLSKIAVGSGVGGLGPFLSIYVEMPEGKAADTLTVNLKGTSLVGELTWQNGRYRLSIPNGLPILVVGKTYCLTLTVDGYQASAT